MKKIVCLVIFIFLISFIFIDGDNMDIIYKSELSDRYENYKMNHKNISLENVVKIVNLNLDYAFYEKCEDALNLDTDLVLVNKYYRLNENYVPKNLEKIDYEYTSGLDIYANKEAIKHFIDMSIDASTIGLIIKTMSAYRTFEYQKNLYNKYLATEEATIVDTYSARAGHSEHQTGLAFDIYNVKKSYNDFGSTDEYKWIKDNAYRYGFILRYEKDKEYITGYKFEPWHIRYVGIDVAKYIYDNDITLEEYLLNT